MKRYHKKIYFPDNANRELIKFTDKLNRMEWRYSDHCLDRIKDWFSDLEGVLMFIKYGIKDLDYTHIFEYYTENNEVVKTCYRINYDEKNDIILVISRSKRLITIYVNEVNDNHVTLKESNYCRN